MAARSFMALTPILTSPQPPPHLRLQPKKPPLTRFPLSSPTTTTAAAAILTRNPRMKRGDLVVANAGPPSTTSLLLAFVLPFSLLAGTVFASIRIADDLDDKFLEELAVNKALMEETGEGEGEVGAFIDGDGTIVLEEEEEEVAAAAAPRSRNRPRREG